MAEDQNRSLQDKFMLRLPDGMRDSIREAAAISGRSMNAEIVHRLANSLTGDSNLHINLEDDLYNKLLLDASLRNMTIEDRAIQILQGDFDEVVGYNSAVSHLGKMIDQNTEYSEMLYELKQRENADFISYYSKVVQISHFLNNFSRDADNENMVALRAEAEELKALTEAELHNLRYRYQDARFKEEQRKRLRELEAEQAQQDIDDQ